MSPYQPPGISAAESQPLQLNTTMTTIQDNYESAADRLRQAKLLISEAVLFIRDAEDEGGDTPFDKSDLDYMECRLEDCLMRLRS